ncbi:MAG: hypothetical protein KME16_20500 [Scytolyngbya sp. HA4215-MV1]|jgi:hypothetical protein|nr:hypothetical protein [Scytolyngbya sp. HA4215-MV1]
MSRKPTLTLFFLLILVFIGFGDRFLPKPLSTYSIQTRNSLNQTIVGLFPSVKTGSPYERTEQAIQKEEKGGQ